MKLVTTKFKSGGLHEKHVVATWNLGNHLSICLQAQGNQEKSVSRWPVTGPSEYWLLANSPASKEKNISTNPQRLCTWTYWICDPYPACVMSVIQFQYCCNLWRIRCKIYHHRRHLALNTLHNVTQIPFTPYAVNWGGCGDPALQAVLSLRNGLPSCLPQARILLNWAEVMARGFAL